MIAIRQERLAETDAREALLDRAYGLARFTKTSQKLREGRLPALSLVATEGSAFLGAVPTFADRALVGTVRLWNVDAGRGRASLLLGPLAVDPSCQGRGVGAALMERALAEAAKLGHRSVLLVGDAPYYGRFGFSAEKTGLLWMPGRFERERLLGLEFVPGALDGAHGAIAATGRRVPEPDVAALAARHKAVHKSTRRAA